MHISEKELRKNTLFEEIKEELKYTIDRNLGFLIWWDDKKNCIRTKIVVEFKFKYILVRINKYEGEEPPFAPAENYKIKNNTELLLFLKEKLNTSTVDSYTFCLF